MSNENFNRMLLEMFYTQNKDTVISNICTNINNRFRGLTFGRLILDGNRMRFIGSIVCYFDRTDCHLNYRTNGMDWRNDIMWAIIDIRNFITFKDLI